MEHISSDLKNTCESLVTVLIPSAGRIERFSLIKRAIYSVRASSLKPVNIIVVVNGDSYNDDVVDWFKAQVDIKYIYDKEPSQANAILVARRLVETPFFSTLDDDDEYLNSATDIKINALLSSENSDMVVTNGFKHINNIDTLMYKNFTDAQSDPLKYLFNFNWLHNCNALYRTDRIDSYFFEDYYLNIEWTWLAFKLSLAKKKIIFLDEPTFRYHDTPMSVSKSEAYMNGHLPLYEKMLSKQPPPGISDLIRRRMSMDWHCRSDRALHAGRYFDALRCHLRSLFLPGGYRFLPYTRRLLPFCQGRRTT